MSFQCKGYEATLLYLNQCMYTLTQTRSQTQELKLKLKNLDSTQTQDLKFKSKFKFRFKFKHKLKIKLKLKLKLKKSRTQELTKNNFPHFVVDTPGRILGLARKKIASSLITSSILSFVNVFAFANLLTFLTLKWTSGLRRDCCYLPYYLCLHHRRFHPNGQAFDCFWYLSRYR